MLSARVKSIVSRQNKGKPEKFTLNPLFELGTCIIMDKWSKQKASETCGGQGMGKFIDYNERKRLNRLKGIKSSIGSNTSHSGWQKHQLEKRRKEQLRQRKKAAKKKPLGDGIKVDTKVTKSDAISKCGLKLKINHECSAANNVQKKTKALAPPKEASQEKKSSLLIHRRKRCPKKQANNPSKAESNLPLLEDRSNISDGKKLKQKFIQKQCERKCGSNQRYQVDDGKEYSDSTPNDTGHAVLKKGAAANSKKYFMDIDSLRREHADAIKMLEELDKCEGNKRRSLDSDTSINSSYSCSPRTLCGHNTLDDEFVRDCSKISKPVGVYAEQSHQKAGGTHTLTDSFLNMTHLSISLRDDFDSDEGDRYELRAHSPMKKDQGAVNLSPVKNLSAAKNLSFASSFDDDEDDDCGDVRDTTPPHTPLKNRSFTSSCASIEDEDFFGDADIDSCSFDEDGYSSGTC